MAKPKFAFSMTGVSKIYPPNKTVLRDISLSFFYGAKIGVLGLNGSGKSTLLKIIAQEEKNVNGEVLPSEGITFGYLKQEPDLDDSKTVKDIVMEGTGQLGRDLKRYEEISHLFADPDLDPDKMNDLLEEQANIQERIEAKDGWDIDRKLEVAMEALRCPPADASVKKFIGR